MDTKEKISVWAGIIALAVLQVSDRVDTELNIYGSDWTGAIGAIGGYVIGFAIVYAVARWLLERYFKRKPQPQPTPPPPFGTPLTT